MSKFELLNKINAKAARVLGRTGLVIQKKTPEILLGLGIAVFVGTVVLASKATQVHLPDQLQQPLLPL